MGLLSPQRAATRAAPAVSPPAPAEPSPGRELFADVWRITLASRAFVMAIAIVTVLVLPLSGLGKPDVDRLTHPFGEVGDAIFAPLARWDAVWYLAIAVQGYEEAQVPAQGEAPAFFPVFPFLVRMLSLGSSPGVMLVVSYLIALSAFLGAMFLLARLTEVELGREYVRPVLLTCAFFPASLFFGAPFTESLFLLFSVGAFYAARTGHWAWAGILAGLASGTRNGGFVLLVPLWILLRYGPRADRPEPPPPTRRARTPILRRRRRPRYRLGREAWWLAVVPSGLIAYSVYLGLEIDHATAWLSSQAMWARQFDGLYGAVVPGLEAAWDAVGELTNHPDEIDFGGFGGAVPRLVDAAFLLFAVVATAGVLHRLPFAYGAYVLVALSLPLSNPSVLEPLMSLPRFVSVLFPFFLWLGLVCSERRLTAWVVAPSVALLGAFTGYFALWYWFA